MFKIVNGYEDVDRNMFFKLKEGSRTRGHKAALVKEQCRSDTRKYSFYNDSNYEFPEPPLSENPLQCFTPATTNERIIIVKKSLNKKVTHFDPVRRQRLRTLLRTYGCPKLFL